MNASLMKKTLRTQGGSEYTIGVRPYRSSRVTLTYDDIMELCKEQGLEEGKIRHLHGWLFYLMSYVVEIEFPKKPKGKADLELESLRHYWDKANGNVAHNYELIIDVSEDIAKGINDTVKEAIEEYKDSFPQMPKIVQDGKPDDPNVLGAGGKP